MKILWNPGKSAWLKRTRGKSFEELLAGTRIGQGDNPARLGQKVLLIELDEYIWVVPYVERDGEFFLKTLYASRKYTRRWRQGKL